MIWVILPIFLSPMYRLRVTVEQFGFPATRIAGGVLAVIAILMPAMTHAQAQNSSVSATLQGSVRDSKARPVAGATVYLPVPFFTCRYTVAPATGRAFESRTDPCRVADTEEF